MNALPPSGFLRLAHILGSKGISEEQAAFNRKHGLPGRTARDGLPPIIPVSRAAWWRGVGRGRYPKPRKLGRLTVWRVEDIRALIQDVSQDQGAL